MPDCEIVALCPPAPIVPLRAAPPFDATLKLIVPLPLPEPPPAIVIQLESELAVHEQPLAVVIDTLPVPPPVPNDCDDGASA